jgi:MFS family permease
MLDEQQRKRVFRIIIITQCLGMITWALFQNGFYLNYFSKLGISSATIATLFALPPLVSSPLLLVFAFYSDRFGKKRLALTGQVLLILSLIVMILASRYSAPYALILIVSSLLIFCVGGSLQGASWFALLNPIIPKEIRGRFFGRLRVSFILVSILFTRMITQMLEGNDSLGTFQFLIGLVLVAAFIRFFTYARIPELENAQGETHHRPSFKKALSAVLAVPGYIQFNSYIFLITLFTAGVPIIFGLMQKDVFGFSPAQITQVGNLFLAGCLVGCGLGGRAVDRYGTRFVFLVTHLAYALVMFFMLFRHWVPWSLSVHIGACSFVFSLVASTAGVAMSSEVMALIPANNKSLSTAINMALFNLALALSALFVSRSIGWKILAPEWSMLGQHYTAYDALLLTYGMITLFMLVTLGLVPKIAKKAQLIPGSGSCPRI